MNSHPPIKFNEPFITGNELPYLQQVIDNGQFAGNGPFTKKVQDFLEQQLDVSHVLLTHSCTAALEMMPLIYDIGPGDEVIIPSYTFVSTASAFVRAGAKVVFCEIDPATMNIDIDDALARITSNTKAIVPVHYGGIPVDTEKIREEIAGSGINIFEDAAQALFSRKNGQPCGSFGELAAFSFHETKNLHSGLGGALIVNDVEKFDRAEDIWERGTNRTKLFKGLVDKYSWVELGSSFYPSELQAAFLLAQLEGYETNLSERGRIYSTYESYFSTHPTVSGYMPVVDANVSLNFHSYFLVFSSEEECDFVRTGLKEVNIFAYIGYVPLHSSPYGMEMGNAPEDLPVTEEYAKRVLRLPFHNNMSEEDVVRTAETVVHLVEKFHG